MEFTSTQLEILKRVQKNIPDSLTPYADIAQEVGCSEEEVLSLLRDLKDTGVIRRFGASIKHQRVGYPFNAMVAWIIEDGEIDKAGEVASLHPNISHCYHRPTPDKENWPYTLFTMIHGQSKDEIQNIINSLIQSTVLEKYAMLESIKELKKISMTYFN